MSESGHGGPSGPGGTGKIDAGSVQGLNCPNCGAAIVLRGMSWTQTVACASCSAVLDAQDPQLRVLQRFEHATRYTPLIPLGSRGQWRGAIHEVIGFQVVSITVESVRYSWHEYLLFNPYHGFRYLTQYDGHWSDVVAVHALPQTVAMGTERVVRLGAHSFRHFQTAVATTRFVLGEFPWEVRTGDFVTASDWVDPPFMLSSEQTDRELNWSLSEYVDGREIWRAFKVPGSPPAAQGVFANQPSPYAASGTMWNMFGVMAMLLMLLLFARLVTADNRVVHEGRHLFQAGDSGAAAFVTPSFVLTGGTANVVVDVDMGDGLSDSWAYLNYALINEGTGTAYDFGREVSYYSGYDSDGSWSEGSRRDRVRVAGVPGGKYFLRVETERPPGSGGVLGTLRVRRDVPSFVPFLLVLLVLFFPPFILTLRRAGFESRRWAESDHAPASASDDEDE
ncbi:MAG: DUF4178 domain-containing protein [Polaromonas sp.]|nr:DUF4178 domain-containing protein [Gemmatimonadaceae bacterium]